MRADQIAANAPAARTPAPAAHPRLRCRVAGCEGLDISGGLCHTHRKKSAAGVAFGAMAPIPPVPICAVAGCGGYLHSGDIMCAAHKRQAASGVRRSDMGIVPPGLPACKIAGCSRRAAAKGLCRACYHSALAAAGPPMSAARLVG